MLQRTRRIWDDQDRHRGDRLRLFTAVHDAFTPTSALYPGSFADIAASFVIDDVTYIDTDRRARRFFADTAGVDQLITEGRRQATAPRWRFIHGDYRSALPIADADVDLLISLYAGPVSRYCTRYLRPGGLLLVNPSHGDASLAALDDRYELAAVITARAGDYRVSRAHLDSYLIPKNPGDAIAERILQTHRGIAYTRSAFAYAFRLRTVS
jgi:hypothetical protein